MLTLLQPNWRYAHKKYFRDNAHVAICPQGSLGHFLPANGYEILKMQPRFLPLTIQSRLPVWPLLIRTYLALPVKPMGKQMLIRARPRR